MVCKDVDAMKMTLITRIGIGAFLSLSAMSLGGEESPIIRLERGVSLMQDDTKIEEALKEFEQVLLVDENSKKLAAEAHYRMAECYLKLGHKEKAQEHVETLREDYQAENKWVEKSVHLLPSGPNFIEPTWGDGELATYEVKLPNGTVVGHFLSGVKAVKKGSEKIWTGYFTRTGGGFSQSRVDFSSKTMKPIQVHSYMESNGEFRTHFKEDGSWEVENLLNSRKTASGQAKPGMLLFDNDQSIHLLRLLPNEIGEEVALPIVVAFMGGHELNFTLKATAHETVSTTAGKFDCVKYESNINQDFWVQRDGPRHLVKMSLIGATLELSKLDLNWNGNEATLLKSEKEHGAVRVPANTFTLPMIDNKKVFRSRLTDEDLRYFVSLVELQDTSNFENDVQGKNKETLELLFKNMNKGSQKLTVDEQAWDEWSHPDGKKAAVGSYLLKQGELEFERLQLCSHGKKKTLTLTFDLRPGEREKVLPLAKEIFTSWEE